MEEIFIIGLAVILPVVLVLFILFKILERSFTGKMIVGALLIMGGMLLLSSFPFVPPIIGIIALVGGVLWILYHVYLSGNRL